MNIGIICEYNPPHKGHAYQIAQLKDQYPDSTVICVMSGNFVQRGTPAIADKYTRAAAALAIGADERVNQFGIICCLCCGCNTEQYRKYGRKDVFHGLGIYFAKITKKEKRGKRLVFTACLLLFLEMERLEL
jgi:hypothetical protein